MTRTLSAPVTVAFDYTRSTGPVIGRFLTGLRDGVVVAGRTSAGEVVVPPLEFDPVTHEPTTDFVEVAPVGTVDVVDLGARAGGRPAVRPAVRVRAGDPRRRDPPVPARARRRLARRGQHRHAGPGALGRGARRRDHRHRLLRAGSATRSDGRVRPAAACSSDHRSPASSRRSRSTTSTPPRPRSRRSTAASPRARSSASAARPARRSTCRRAARARPTAPRRPRRSSCPQTGTRHDVLHRQRAVPRAEDHAAVRLGVRPARRRRHRLPAPDPRHPGRGGPDGDAGRRRSGSRARSGAPRSRTSTTSVRPASRTRTTRPTSSTSEGD